MKEKAAAAAAAAAAGDSDMGQQLLGRAAAATDDPWKFGTLEGEKQKGDGRTNVAYMDT